VDFDVEGQVDFGDAAQVFPQDFFLDFELMLVAGVLVMTSAAAGEVGARGRDAVWRRLDDGVDSRAGEAGFLLGEGSLDFFSGQNEGNEHGFAAAAGFICGGSGGIRGGGKACQTVASVDQLFDCEEQELILRHGTDGSSIPRLQP
jgi:hypothetical protein